MSKLRQDFADHPRFVPNRFDEFLEFLEARFSTADYLAARELLHASVNPAISARRFRVQEREQ